MAYFNYQHQKIFYRIAGKGDPLLLIHGNSVSSEMFSPVLTLFSESFKVILYDFPGHGRSSRVEEYERDSWYYNAEVAHALLEQLNLAKVNVIGTSGGALVGINLALEHPGKVNCLVADSFEGEAPLGSYIKTLKEDREKDKENSFAKDFWMDMHGSDWEKVVDLDSDMNTAFASTGKSFFHKSISELQVPALLTGSMQDEFCQRLDKIYEGMKRKNPNLDIHLFEEGNHLAMLSNENEFFELIKDYFFNYQ